MNYKSSKGDFIFFPPLLLDCLPTCQGDDSLAAARLLSCGNFIPTSQ
ncbi:MAG TPA: hypothetical protein PLE97_05010 [Tenuifilaceae bacterium]|nr:hypothetical protein [Tenuifilaceae bacterium]